MKKKLSKIKDNFENYQDILRFPRVSKQDNKYEFPDIEDMKTLFD